MKSKITPNTQFTRLTTIKCNDQLKQWLCKCICGKKIWVAESKLKSLHTRSCGCLLRDFCKNKCIDMINQKFGMLTVISKLNLNNDSRGCKWICKCDCGQERQVYGADLRRKYIRSCGCDNKRKTSPDLSLIGKRYGKIVVVGFFNKKIYKVSCKCDCGREFETTIYRLKSGDVKSCSCLTNCLPKDHPRHIPKISGATRQIDSEIYKKWRQEVFNRDKYQCQLCRKKSGVDLEKEQLNAHHLNSWRHFPAERYEIDNGITLCTTCHKHLHHLYGHGTIKENIQRYKDKLELD